MRPWVGTTWDQNSMVALEAYSAVDYSSVDLVTAIFANVHSLYLWSAFVNWQGYQRQF